MGSYDAEAILIRRILLLLAVLGKLGGAGAIVDIWRRLPPAQRRQLVILARRHGPKLAARGAKAVQGRRRK